MNKTRFGAILREVRKKQELSMRRLAYAADMDPAYLSRLENGLTGEPKQDTVERLCHALCTENKLKADECEKLTRKLLITAGHLQDQEELLDDVTKRFAARLREEGLSEQLVEQSLGKVSLTTMRAVLLGKERLEIGTVDQYSADEISRRKASGEEVHELGSIEDTNRPDSAQAYLARYAEGFQPSPRKTETRRPSEKEFRAGSEATITIHRKINKNQSQQLRLIARLIESLLQENT